jgi:hypothetical protein
MAARQHRGRYVNPDFWRDKRVFVTGHTGFRAAGCVCRTRSVHA